MLAAWSLLLEARIRRTLALTVVRTFANDLIRFIPWDSVKFWMFKNKCHASVYRIPRFELLCPNIYDNLNICLFDPVLDMYARQSLL